MVYFVVFCRVEGFFVCVLWGRRGFWFWFVGGVAVVFLVCGFVGDLVWCRCACYGVIWGGWFVW